MPDPKTKSHDAQPPPTRSKGLPNNAAGQPMPRRTSPENSVTLQHHRLARDASMKNQSSRVPQVSFTKAPTSSPRRGSSGESQDTGNSDPNKWFDQSNQNPTASYSQAMDVDPPFYQRESDSSNDDGPKATYPFHLRPGASSSLKPAVTHSSSTDDYRSVIDDLTVEIQRLKEELKKYKQLGPDLLKKEKLFEIKVHGLPKRKKRELEATLRDFASGLSETPSAEASSARNKKASRHANRLYSASGSMSKHASSSSGSNSRPVDSAYASMSTGPNSSGTSLNRPSMSSRAKSSESKVESYLKDIPEGLYPRHMVLSEKDKKKLVVKRLEQLFTGKMSGRNLSRDAAYPAAAGNALGSVMSEATTTQPAGLHQPPTLGGGAPLAGGSAATAGAGATSSATNNGAVNSSSEPCREARILPLDESGSGKKSRSRDNASTENSNGDQTESGGNGTAAGEANVSPPNAPLPEQRPTRPRDLDPDRAQNPSDNMDYIRHLGLVPPELLSEAKVQDVAPDADGWVYLNLLCNLAQLHMINVTPDFIRTAVSEKSTKFQLSHDGRKIRWRGGSEGTKFSSDSSGDNSQKSPMTDDTDGSNNDGQRKKPKTTTAHPGSGDDFNSAHSSKYASKFNPQISGSSESFHYKPLFAHQSSSIGQTSLDETVSSLGPAEESNLGESRWGNSGSGSSQRKKRRLDGAIIYYSGAPFCTDLSGDPGDLSPATHMASGSHEVPQQTATSDGFVRPDPPQRTTSGSTLKVRPLSDETSMFQNHMEVAPESCVPGLTSDDSDEDDAIDADFSWSGNQQYLQVLPLEPCGLGGVLPDDHFMVLVATKRPKVVGAQISSLERFSSNETTDSIATQLALMTTSSPRPLRGLSGSSRGGSPPVEIEYVSGRIKRLAPVPLPPPAIFFPPFSSESDGSSDDYDLDSDADDDEFVQTDSFVPRRPHPHTLDNPYPDDEDMTSGDEEGEEPDNEDEPPSARSSPRHKALDIALPPREPVRRTSSSAIAAAGTARGRSKSTSAGLPPSGSSNATVGDAESELSSSGDGSG